MDCARAGALRTRARAATPNPIAEPRSGHDGASMRRVALRTVHWDHQADGGANSRRGIDLDLAAVNVHDLLHDDQPEAGAGRLRGKKWPQDLRASLRGDPLPVVSDLDHRVTPAPIESHLDLGVLPVLRGFQRVADHV